MRSEAEIRRQVETRLRRWGLLALNGILWVGAAKLIYGYSQYGNFGQFTGAVALFMVAWAALLGLHALRTFYVEGREWLVRRQLSGNASFMGCKKNANGMTRLRYRMISRFSLPADDGEYSVVPFRHEADDGALVDFPFSEEPEAKAKYE